ncbi:hypothetical protein RUM43_001181 [Polyplax serrata]|uniref:Tat-binding homolog 7 n=1 Tax=Polyplax serrata TaxID=468196 RepID=A0AAN8XQ84_POLSC
MDNNSDFHIRTKSDNNMRWRRELRTRYPRNYRPMERISKHPTRSCQLQLRSKYYDDVDESDIPFNDDDDEEEDVDEDDSIFSPVKGKKYNSERPERRISSRVHQSRSLRQTTLTENNTNNETVEKTIENGIKTEDDNDQDGEGEGVRRSKRQRKLLYDNFNQSWILGTQTVLRGYPAMYRGQENAVENGSSNDDATRDEEVPEPQENDSKPLVNNVENDDDMYTNIKRTRRQRIRYSPSNELSMKSRLRERRNRVTVAADSSESEESRASSVGRERQRRRTIQRDDSSDELPDRQPIADTGRGRVYHLRQNKPAVERFQITNNNRPTRRSSRLVLCSVPRRYERKNDESSSSDEERFQRKKAKSLAKARSRCMPLNYKPSESNQLQKTPAHSTKTSAAGPKGPADVDPMAIDTSIRFDKVGGLEGHLKCLKEMVVFPMLYKEIFEKFKIQPPKGVLFHGPPGTGKTLIARALANECSQGDRKVSFFMRKGADCLSKWVGESERQLRLLFEQAYQMRPSIIFFDEIDGLAPVRSSKQDQIHASIVSTLLAFLDGLDDRGEIIVIGATNRIDAIDPALRRPGRFDRELYFPLPGKKEREEILAIHTKPWSSPPSQKLMAHLAEKSVGYCGSDLRLLCSEAVVQALRRRYPQIYKSSQKLLLQADAVNVEEEDFKLAQSKIIPASSRVNRSSRSRLSDIVAPLLQSQLDAAFAIIKDVFPQSLASSRDEICNKPIYRPHYLVCGCDGSHGQTSHIAPALLDLMEHIPVHTVNLSTLFELTNRNAEEAIIQIIREATRNPPSILYLPCIDKWWDLLPFTAHEIFLDKIQSIPINSPVLLLGTSHSSYSTLNSEIKSIFKYDMLEMRKPNKEERKNFFRPLFMEICLKVPDPPELKEEDWEELPVAPPPPPPEPTELEMEELHNQEEHKLRELRIFLRDICSKLARNRQFFMFTKPVDINEVPDYLNIIKTPMDLETMMTNIDLHRYNSAQEFLSDIDLIVRNALEYNPERDPEDKLIRHRACSLRDTAYTLIKAEMDTDFEEECRKISKKRKEKKEEEEKGKTAVEESNANDASNNINSVHSNHPLQPFIVTGASKSCPTTEMASKKRDNVKPKSATPIGTYLNSRDRIKRKKKMGWAQGLLKKKVIKKTANTEKAPVETAEPESTVPASQSNSETTSQDAVQQDDQQETEQGNNCGEKESLKRPRSASMGNSPTQTGNSGSPCKVNVDTPVNATKRRKTSKRKVDMEETSDHTGVVEIDTEKLEKFWIELTERTENCSFENLLDCHSMLYRVIFKYRDVWHRKQLLEDIEAEIKKFEELYLVTKKTDSRIQDVEQEESLIKDEVETMEKEIEGEGNSEMVTD